MRGEGRRGTEAAGAKSITHLRAWRPPKSTDTLRIRGGRNQNQAFPDPHFLQGPITLTLSPEAPGGPGSPLGPRGPSCPRSPGSPCGRDKLVEGTALRSQAQPVVEALGCFLCSKPCSRPPDPDTFSPAPSPGSTCREEWPVNGSTRRSGASEGLWDQWSYQEAMGDTGAIPPHWKE